MRWDDKYEAAFPMCDSSSGQHQTGLTKREYFAAMALQGLLANPENTSDIKSLAECASNCAEALSNELNKGKI